MSKKYRKAMILAGALMGLLPATTQAANASSRDNAVAGVTSPAKAFRSAVERVRPPATPPGRPPGTPGRP